MNDTPIKKQMRIRPINNKKEPEIDPSLKISDRSIHTFFYLAIRNHVDLGNLADKKANLLLSVSALIFSLLIAKLYFKITSFNNEYFVIPFAILIITSVVTLVLAVLVTRPKVTEGKFDKKALEAKSVNLAFFGNFHSMSFEEYNNAVVDMLEANEDIRSTLTQDLYFLGKVLNKKYRLLNGAYLVFIIGFALAMLTAIVITKL